MPPSDKEKQESVLSIRFLINKHTLPQCIQNLDELGFSKPYCYICRSHMVLLQYRYVYNVYAYIYKYMYMLLYIPLYTVIDLIRAHGPLAEKISKRGVGCYEVNYGKL